MCMVGGCIHVRSEDKLGCCPHFPRCLGWSFLCRCSGELVDSPSPPFIFLQGSWNYRGVYSTRFYMGSNLGPHACVASSLPTEPALLSAPTGRTVKLRLGCEGRTLIQSSSADPCHFVTLLPIRTRSSGRYEPLGRSSSGMHFLFPPWSWPFQPPDLWEKKKSCWL